MKLAADTINGVYEVNYIPPHVLVYLDTFKDELSTLRDGQVIYGIVSDEEAEEIDAEYGIDKL